MAHQLDQRWTISEPAKIQGRNTPTESLHNRPGGQFRNGNAAVSASSANYQLLRTVLQIERGLANGKPLQIHGSYRKDTHLRRALPSFPGDRSRCRAAGTAASPPRPRSPLRARLPASGSSNIVSSRIFSMIERRPRAPVLRVIALRAISRQSVLVEGQFDIFHLEQALILLDQRVLRLGQDLDQRGSSRSSSVARTGRRPMNSGMRPNLTRSSGSSSRSTSPTRRSSGEA
jgi:hypothetical protein